MAISGGSLSLTFSLSLPVNWNTRSTVQVDEIKTYFVYFVTVQDNTFVHEKYRIYQDLTCSLPHCVCC